MSSPTGVALAIELTEFGAALRKQRYRRDHPKATDEEVDEFMRRWMLDRRGAPGGDAEGVSSERFT